MSFKDAKTQTQHLPQPAAAPFRCAGDEIRLYNSLAAGRGGGRGTGKAETNWVACLCNKQTIVQTNERTYVCTTNKQYQPKQHRNAMNNQKWNVMNGMMRWPRLLRWMKLKWICMNECFWIELNQMIEWSGRKSLCEWMDCILSISDIHTWLQSLAIFFIIFPFLSIFDENLKFLCKENNIFINLIFVCSPAAAANGEFQLVSGRQTLLIAGSDINQRRIFWLHCLRFLIANSLLLYMKYVAHLCGVLGYFLSSICCFALCVLISTTQWRFLSITAYFDLWGFLFQLYICDGMGCCLYHWPRIGIFPFQHFLLTSHLTRNIWIIWMSLECLSVWSAHSVRCVSNNNE